MKRGLLREFLEREPTDFTAECLERIRAQDGELRAWVEVDPQPPLANGPLNGIPFGAKDIFETTELHTQYGSPLFAGRKGNTEASLITALRKRGAILLGKTQTTAFAYYDPPPTRNPRNPAHTPGGSSSGSAAAVAAGMVPFSLGTQTQGSLLRPASYCGICGFKPTYGLLPRDGILPFAPSLDTPGFFTQTAGDMQMLWERLGNTQPGSAPSRLGSLQRPPKLLPGWKVDEVELPFRMEEILSAVQLINAYEGARTHRDLWLQYGEKVGSKLSKLVSDGLKIPNNAYVDALGILSDARASMGAVYEEYPVLLSAAATGPAPLGLESTGDPRMNAPWSGLHGPAIAIPMPGDGLPVGLQLTAAPGNDNLLLETACRIEVAL